MESLRFFVFFSWWYSLLHPFTFTQSRFLFGNHNMKMSVAITYFFPS